MRDKEEIKEKVQRSKISLGNAIIGLHTEGDAYTRDLLHTKSYFAGYIMALSECLKRKEDYIRRILLNLKIGNVSAFNIYSEHCFCKREELDLEALKKGIMEGFFWGMANESL